MKKRLVFLAVGVLSAALLAGCGNSNQSANNSSSSSSKTSRVEKKATTKNSKTRQSVASSSEATSSSSASSDHSDSSSTGVHLTGGQSTIDYITKLKGDKGWTIVGGTYGGAHGAPTTPDYVPYNTVKSDDGTEWYYVYQDGRVVEQKDLEQHDDQGNDSNSNDQNSSAVTTNDDDDDETDD